MGDERTLATDREWGAYIEYLNKGGLITDISFRGVRFDDRCVRRKPIVADIGSGLATLPQRGIKR